ncbi:hypothetical protein [Marivita sp.]|jgi:hypothetical protein|uniref:hypothetical protein n=1 Tax=Marivita sp. TaxID=2003365 RepID=UPI003F6B3149
MKDYLTDAVYAPASSSGQPNDLAARERAISNLCRKTEAVFLVAGDHLSATSDALGKTRNVLAVFDEMNAKGTLSELRQHGQWHDTEMRSLSDEVLKVLDNVTALMTRARGVDGQVRELRDILKMMNIVVLNARITVAAIKVGPKDNGSNLTGFTEDATRLVAELGTILSGLDEAMQRIKKGSDDALTRARFLGDLLTSSLSGPVAALNRELASFEEHIKTLGSASAEIADQSKALMGASATAVAGLQIGDTTRQRLEHVLTILERIPGAWDESEALTALAAHQMEDIAQAHVDGVDNIREGSAALQQGILNLVRDHLQVFEQRNGSRKLKTGLEEIENRIAQAVTTQDQLMAFARTLSQEFEALTSIIAAGESFEARMRMIGINAVIACARLGRRGLALREIAGQLQQLARDASTRLPAVKTELAEMIELAGETIVLLETASERANALPQGTVRQLSDGVNDIGEAAYRSGEIVSEIRETLDESRGWLTPVTDHAHLIEKTARMFSHDCELDGYPGKEDSVATEVFAIYTMERERDIHRKVILPPVSEDTEMQTIVAETAPAAAASDDPFDDIFF